jgi:hypothetical protein
MHNRLKSALAAMALGMLVQAPAHSAELFTYNNGLSCPSLSVGCAIFTNGNLVEPSQGYGAIPGFDSEFARGTAITASLNGMPAHTTVSIDFLLAVIDSWDGLGGGFGPDIFEVKVDGVTVFSAGYDIFDAADQSLVRGTQLAYNVPLGFGSWNDAAYDMASVAALHDIPHSASDMIVEFLFPNSQGIDDESFALENLRISANVSGVPEPSTLALLGLGLAGLAATRRRKQ